jgi:endonuclease/exonuclease/phosphatase family metal-dependent hydrolase
MNKQHNTSLALTQFSTGMLESDAMRIVMGNREFAQYMGERHGYYVDYGPGPSQHTWGCLMLSKYPIMESHHLLLPSPEGELACAIHAKVLLPNKSLLQVVISHNGQEETPLDRELQAKELGKLFKHNKDEPIIYLGYITSAPHQHVYNLMFKDGDMQDIDASDSDRWCQYIAYRGLERIGYARLSRGSLSDT